ncbi:MAG TPA: bifunctional salicylyl-CoA 5-hydroxylase/oxidoreductase [Gemmatimonadales bacterium]|jgi:anthraniloyl-CoA monooxygenase
MRIVCIGGGPAGLYLAILMKRADPDHQVTVVERNRLTDTFGFGVVFSDATQEGLAAADPPSQAAMAARLARWDDIEIHFGGQVVRSTGHGFAGISRLVLLEVLAEQASTLGVQLRFSTEASDLSAVNEADLVVGADGFSSMVRTRLAEHFQPTIDYRPNRFVWLGTTRPFPAFTFYFKPSPQGLWRVHAYQYEPGHSTFIVETTEACWRATGLGETDEDATVAFCEALFAEELDGHRLLRNRSIWRRFPTVRTARWHHQNVVLLGDAAHTAHFSVGSGTKLAMEDAIALAGALHDHPAVPEALAAYEAGRRPAVESLQRAAQASLQWFEDTERYLTMEPIQFAFALLSRSLRVTHENLRVRDPGFVAKVDQWFAGEAEQQSRVPVPCDPPPPPLFTPFRLRELVLPNRVVVSPMCQYSSDDGMPGEWHLVHLGSRAIGGAGLVMTEMTDVSREARISPACAGMYRPEHADSWRRIVEFVHRHSEAKIGMQLGHAGRKGSTQRLWEAPDEPLQAGNWPLLAPSPIPYLPHSQVPREASPADLAAVKQDYVRAAELADSAGFDLLELHYAHGYLMASFISPLTNRRTDQYGGSLENRMRFPLEVFDAVRAVWPAPKPMSVRISAVDWAPGGMEPESAVAVGRLLAAHGCDVVDVSTGQTVPDATPVYGRLYQTPFSDRIRQEAGIATMAVGNISSYADANTILAAGRADLVVLARTHLWDPYWTRHAARALGWPMPWPPQYEALDRYTPRL